MYVGGEGGRHRPVTWQAAKDTAPFVAELVNEVCRLPHMPSEGCRETDQETQRNAVSASPPVTDADKLGVGSV
jgi:hypothetical protein